MTMSIADVNAARDRQDGTVASPDGPRASRPNRRTFTREYKMRILGQYESASSPQERNALLRREGIYTAYPLQFRYCDALLTCNPKCPKFAIACRLLGRPSRVTHSRSVAALPAQKRSI